MSRSHHHARKAHRDDAVTNAIVNLIEDMNSAQRDIDCGNGGVAKLEVEDAVRRFRSKVTESCIRDLIVAVDLGRIRLTLDYADDLGEISATYIARRSWN